MCLETAMVQGHFDICGHGQLLSPIQEADARWGLHKGVHHHNAGSCANRGGLLLDGTIVQATCGPDSYSAPRHT